MENGRNLGKTTDMLIVLGDFMVLYEDIGREKHISTQNKL